MLKLIVIQFLALICKVLEQVNKEDNQEDDGKTSLEKSP